MIPVSVILTVRNEERRMPACLKALEGFQEIIVVDSHSQDKTAVVAAQLGAQVIPFKWNGVYPKKRQWCLENLHLKSDWIFFVDADEIVTEGLKQEIAELFKSEPDCAGYFVKGQYCVDGKLLRYGIQNNKLVLFNRTKVEFPVIDDLDIPGMGEMEGHYQPVLKNSGDRLGILKSPMIHDALDDERAWTFRHEKYARWEMGMNAKQAWPIDPVPWRQTLKTFLRTTRFRPQLMFLISYIGLLGFLDGKGGLKLAKSRSRYYKIIQRLEQKN